MLTLGKGSQSQSELFFLLTSCQLVLVVADVSHSTFNLMKLLIGHLTKIQQMLF